MPDDDLTGIERELREAAAQLDPVPPHLLAHADAAFTWRTIDADLAELAYDSATEPEPALVRGGDQPWLLTFQTDGLSIEVEVTGATLVGQLVPPQAAEIEIQHGGRSLPVTADPLGRFSATLVGAGPLRLRCQPAGAAGRLVVSDWFAL